MTIAHDKPLAPHINFLQTEDGVARRAAQAVVAQLDDKPASIIVLPTGTTPKRMYGKILDIIEKRRGSGKPVDVTQATFINLDEYAGLKHDAHSYARYMRDNFYGPLEAMKSGFNPAQTLIPNWNAPDPEAECERFRKVLDRMDPPDLVVLGIGRNGHIAFCEPGTPFDKGVHVAHLTDETRQDNAADFGGDEKSFDMVPKQAMTLGRIIS